MRQLFKTALITRLFKQLKSHLQQLKTNYVKEDLISLTASKNFKKTNVLQVLLNMSRIFLTRSLKQSPLQKILTASLAEL